MVSSVNILFCKFCPDKLTQFINLPLNNLPRLINVRKLSIILVILHKPDNISKKVSFKPDRIGAEVKLHVAESNGLCCTNKKDRH